MPRTLMSLALGLAAGIGATAYGQGTGGSGDSGGQCMVTQLRLRIATSDDDLRGGQDNLNIVVYFKGGEYQVAPNVNHGKNWPNNSVNMVEIPLNRPVPPGEIWRLRLVHIADGGFNIHNLPELATPAAPIAIAQAFQSPDNWNMADLEVAAIGNGVVARIAKFGFHRFTGSKPDLIIGTNVPRIICGSGRPTGNSHGGSGKLMSQDNEKGLVAEQPRSPVLEENRAANAITPGARSNASSGVASEKPVTNADILNMLRAGISEEAILTTIRTRPASFDVSNQARATFDRECAALKHKRQTNSAWAAEIKNIWEGMTNVMICQNTNGRGGEDTCGPDSRLLSGASGSGSGNGQLLQGSAGGVSSGSSGANPTLNPIAPRSSGSASGNGSNTGSGGTNPSFQPLIPRDSSNGSSGSGSTKLLTIDDVVKMLQAGLPEQAILASIRSSSADFNLPNKAKTNEAKTRFFRELRKPPAGTPANAWRNELNGIWEAMVAKAAEGAGAPAATPSSGGISAGNKNADELSPQPYPPRGGKSAATAAARERLGPPSKLLKTKLAPAKKGPTIANAAAASHKATILATLQSQKSAADAVAAQMKTAVRLAGQPGMSPGPSQTMSASGSSGPAQSNSRTAANAQVGATSSSNTSQNPGIAASARLSQALGPAETQVLMCAQDPTMRVFQVSGTEGPITFTTDPAGNFYTITGCSFGGAGSNAKAYIYLGNSFHQEFQIQEWNDLYIKCNLDPSLTGLGDLDNLTLVVQRSDGKQAVKPGFKFYAMRGLRRLTYFPKQYFSLNKLSLQDVSDLVGGIQSPVTDNFPNNTAEAYWYDPDLQPMPDKGFTTQQNTPPSGTDIYDFSHLAPGFEVDSASLSVPDPGSYCNSFGYGDHLSASSGSFSGQFNGAQLWITWQGWNCNHHSQNCDFWGCYDTFAWPGVTDYGIDIVVEGPRGVDPWTGQPIGH